MDWINLDSIMASLDIRALEVIRKPPEERTQKDTDLLVPWLKKKTRVVQTLETETVAQIVKFCDYKRAKKDEVIIQQGERGDTLYIILSGTVSVYIDASRMTEDGIPLEAATLPGGRRWGALPDTSGRPSNQDELPRAAGTVPLRQDNESQRISEEGSRSSPGEELESNMSEAGSQKKAHKSKEKNKYGKFIVKIETGKCFGEIALISEKNIRNATIITDGPTDLMLIRKDLYDRTLKDYQKREFAERRQFVRKHPLFKNWAKHLQRQLEMSLVKEIYTFGSHIIHQGEPWNGLTFIQKGRARLLVEPARHKQQYKDLAPFPTKNDIYAIEFNRPQRPPPEHPEEILRWEHIEIRRTEGYAAAERRHLHRQIPVCIVEEGEILGDIEYIFNLSTYTASAVCMAPTEVFVLTTKNIDRLITKKTPSTASVLKMEVETKLRNRLRTKQGAEVFLYRHLFFKLTEEIQASPRPRPDFKVGSNVKRLPDKETLFLHLMHAFAENRAAAVQPHIDDSIFLKERMREKAKLREIVRRRQADNGRPAVRTRRVRRPPSPKPRSIKHLKMALRKQEEGVEATEREYLAKEYRNLEQEVLREFYQSALSTLSESGDVEQGLQVICDRLQKAGRSGREPLPALRVTQSMPDLSGSKVGGREAAAGRDGSPDLTFVTRLNEPEVGSPRGQGRAEPASPTRERTSPKPELPEAAAAETGEGIADAPIQVEKPEPILMMPPLNAASELVVAKEAVHMTPRSVTSPDGVNDDPLSEEAKWRLQQLQESIKDTVKLAPEDPIYRDWETSDKSLSYLEQRLKNFKINREPTFVRLPPLQRFEAGDNQNQPRPGAKVVIQRKRCNTVTKDKFATKNSHVNHHVVPAINDYDKLKYHKILSHFALDDVRERWLEKYGKKSSTR